MTTRAEIVAEARSWIGTPFRHQAHMKHVGCDCVGLVRGVCSTLGICPDDPWQLPGAEKYRGYSRTPDGYSLMEACGQYMDRIPVDEARPGDVFVLKWAQHPQHAGFFGNYVHGGLSLIHAFSRGAKGDGVVEHRIDPTWRARICAAFVIRQLEE